MQLNKNIPYYLIAVGLFIIMKFGFRMANTEDLIFLLKPTNKVVSLFTGSPSIFSADNGYFYENLNIVIDKSCSGFNFWALCFLVFTFLFVKSFNKHAHKILSIPLALLFAFILTIFVNASRIFASIMVHNQTKNNFVNHQDLIHEAVGVITNLSFLILAYLLFEKLLNQKRHNAKLT